MKLVEHRCHQIIFSESMSFQMSLILNCIKAVTPINVSVSKLKNITRPVSYMCEQYKNKDADWTKVNICCGKHDSISVKLN